MKMLSIFCLDVCMLYSNLMLIKFGDNRSMVANVGPPAFILSQKQVLAFTKVSA